MPRMKRPTERTSIDLTPGGIDALSELAERLGHVVVSGGGRGRKGSMSRLLDAIALAYKADPDAVVLHMDAYRKTNEDNDEHKT